MEFIFVRHGETDYNKQRRVTGARLDPPLNETGVKQAEELAEALKDIEFDVIVSSALQRAKQTAEIIKKHFDVPLEVVPQFGERDFGSLSGKTWQEIGEAMGLGEEKAKEIDFNQEFDYRPYGGQSAEETEKDLRGALAYIKEKYPGKKVLVVSHGGVLRLMHYLHTKEISKEHRQIVNASIHRFEI